ncbi:hypothetical protein Peur_028211 [Populus x canadensis]
MRIATTLSHPTTTTTIYSASKTPQPQNNPSSISSQQELSLLSKLHYCKSVSQLKQIHAFIIKTPRSQTHHIYAKKLIYSLLQLNHFLSPSNDKNLNYAHSLVKQWDKPDVYAYNALIQRMSSTSMQSFHLYQEMLIKGIIPDTYTIPFVLKACSHSLALWEGQQIHAHCIKMFFMENVYVNNTLMRLYAVCGMLDVVEKLFEQGPVRDLVSWTTLIQAYLKMGFPIDAVSAFFRMCQANLRPDNMILVVVLSACSKLGDLSLGRKIHEYMVHLKVNVDSDVFLGNALVDMYLKCGEAGSARHMFDKMPVKNLVSWNSMISGLAQQGQFKEALDVFRRMQKVGLKPDDVTLVAVLNSCANLGMLDLGKWVHAYIDKSHLRADGFIGNALVDMYAKSGSIDQAFRVFQAMKLRDVYSAIQVAGNNEWSLEKLWEFGPQQWIMLIPLQDTSTICLGTLWTATAHAFTAVVGAGILALPWSVAQLGWILGPFVLVLFAIVTYYIASLLCDCYRTPDPVTGKRNYTYIHAVRELLGPKSELICGILQYSILWGTMIGYTVTTAISIASVKRSTCFHDKGHNAKCGVSGNLYMLIYGAIEIFLSQCPNLEKVAILSVIASVTSFAYALIALCLSTAKLSSNHEFKGSLMVAMVVNTEATSERFWQAFQALGNIALAYTYCMLLLEIQDTLKSVPPENKVMKRVSLFVVVGTAFFYISLGCIGYAAFGNDVPGNILSGFYEPFWLVDMANIAVIIHLIGAYQVYAQPLFAINEKWIGSRWPTSSFNKIYTIRYPCSRKGSLHLTINRLFLRTIFVVITTAVAMMFPFFNAILGLLGSVSFWPLTVYFPISMYIVQAKIKRGSYHWFGLQALGFVCLIVTIVSGIGSVAGMVQFLKKARLFHIEI